MSKSILQRLLKEMEDLLGCWRSIFLPLSSDPELSEQAEQFCKSLSAQGVMVNEDMLKVVIYLFISHSTGLLSYRRLTPCSGTLELDGWRRRNRQTIIAKNCVSGRAVCLCRALPRRS